MKLVRCKKCNDIILLRVYEKRSCFCGESSGQYYTDGVKAWYSGEHAVPLGIDNPSLRKAIKNQPEDGLGERFEAFVIPKNCTTFFKI